MFSKHTIEVNLLYQKQKTYNKAKNTQDIKTERSRRTYKNPLAGKLYDHLSAIKIGQENIHLQIFKIKEIITEYYKSKVKEEKKDETAEDGAIKTEEKKDEVKYLLDADSIRALNSLLFFILKLANSLSPFHFNFLPIVQNIKDLIHFLETQCCKEDNYKPLDCNMIGTNYSVIWCASSMERLISYLNNPTIEKNDWFEDYKIYEQRSLGLNAKLKKEIPFWADYEKALLSYQYLQEAEILIRSNNSDDKLKSEKLLDLAEEVATKSLQLYLNNKPDTKTTGCGQHYDCAALYIYHELYKNFLELGLHSRIRPSIASIKKACEKGKEDIGSLKIVLNDWNKTLPRTQGGTLERLRKKINEKNKANATNEKKWEDSLKELIDEVESHFFMQDDRFNEWDKIIIRLEDEIKINALKLENERKTNDLTLKYKESQTILQSVELPDGFLMRIDFFKDDYTIKLTIIEDTNENMKLLLKCFLFKKNDRFNFRIKYENQKFNIIFLEAFNLDTKIFEKTLQDYIIQVKEENEKKVIPSIIQPEYETVKLNLLNIDPLPIDIEREKLLLEKEKRGKEIDQINHEETEKRKKGRNKYKYAENMENALQRHAKNKQLEALSLEQTKANLDNLRNIAIKEQQKNHEEKMLNSQGSDSIYDDTKILIAFDLLETNLKIDDDNKQHILFGCILHIILELDYRLRCNDSYYTLDSDNKNELKTIILGIRNKIVHQSFDLESLINIVNCLIPLRVFFHKNCNNKKLLLSNTPFDKLLCHFKNLNSITCMTDVGANQGIETIKNDLLILNKMNHLLINFIEFNKNYEHQQFPNDMQFFLCYGIVIQIQECTKLFSASFTKLYGNQLNEFRLYRNQLAHRNRIITSDSLYDDYTIYNWDKMFEIISNKVPGLLDVVTKLQFSLQKQHENVSFVLTKNSLFSPNINENNDGEGNNIIFNSTFQL